MDKNIGKLNVEITADASKLEQAADGASGRMKKLSEDLGGVNNTRFEQLQMDFDSAMKNMQDATANTNKELSKLGTDVKPIDTSASTSRLGELQRRFDSVLDVIKTKVYPIGDSIASAFGRGASGADSLTNSVTNTNLEIQRLSPELQAFQAKIEQLSMTRLKNEVGTLSSKLILVEAEAEAIRQKMAQTSYSEMLRVFGQQLNTATNNANELQTKIDMVKSRIDMLNADKVTRLSENMDKSSASATKFGKELSKTVDGGIRKLKKLVISLIGLRTLWSLITRATRDYLSRNKELDTQIQSMISALGQALSPLIVLSIGALQEIVRWLMVAIAYFTTFINVIFGLKIPIVQNAKAMKKWADATKEAKGQLAGFDDLNILQTPQDNQTDLATDMSFYDITPYLAPMAEFQKYLTENRDMIIALIVAFAAMAAALMVVNLAMGLFALFSSPISAIIIGIGILIGLLIYVAYNWEEFVTGIVASLQEAWDGIVWLFNRIVQGIADAFNGVIGWIAGGIEKIMGAVTSVIKSFVTFWNTSWNSIWKTIQGIWSKITGLFAAGGELFKGITDGLGNIFKGIVNDLISGINAVINAPLKFINGILNSIRAISILGLKPFAGLWGNNPIPIPRIPKLATGAVASGPTIAQIGEGRYDEAVIPLGQSPQFADMKRDIADMVVAAVGASGSSGNIEVVVKIKEETLAKYAISGINKMQRQAGRTLLEV